MKNYKHICVPYESVWKTNQSAFFFSLAHTRSAYASGEFFLNCTYDVYLFYKSQQNILATNKLNQNEIVQE